MKPTDLKLEKLDESVIRRIYMQMIDEHGEIGGPDIWFNTVMYFLEHKGYEIAAPEQGE